MQDKIEVLKFEETPEINSIGIAHVRLFKQIILKYKVVSNKDGSGYFVAPPSYKRTIEGVDKWSQWFMLDSQYLTEEVIEAISSYVKQFQATKQSKSVNSSNQSNPYANVSNEEPLPF